MSIPEAETPAAPITFKQFWLDYWRDYDPRGARPPGIVAYALARAGESQMVLMHRMRVGGGVETFDVVGGLIEFLRDWPTQRRRSVCLLGLRWWRDERRVADMRRAALASRPPASTRNPRPKRKRGRGRRR